MPQQYFSLHVYRKHGPQGSVVLVRKVVHHLFCGALNNARPPSVVVGDPLPWPDAERLITHDGHQTCRQCTRRGLYGQRSEQTAHTPSAPPARSGGRPLPLAVQPGRYRTFMAATTTGPPGAESHSLYYLCRECGPELAWSTRSPAGERWVGWTPHPAMGVLNHWSTGYRPVVTDRYRHDRWHTEAHRRASRNALFEQTVQALFGQADPP